MTPPEPGWVRDGLDPEYDMAFSSAAASLRATFSDFNDPDSGIDFFIADIYRRSSGNAFLYVAS